ncbi:MAG: solute carrier family 23 protein, partial [Bacilli bacterium]|nr:solute carrier family 23 protein [Bacilli bacterium]
QVAILFIPVALVTICEHIGDHKNLGNIIGRDLLEEEPGMTRTLIGDGLATAVSGSLCGAANTTYGENVAVVGVTRIASVNVILLAAVMAIGFGFFAPLTLVLSSVPSCITGGVSLILYGFIASSGVKMLIKEKVDFNKTKNIIVASVILVSGIGGLTFVFGSGNSAITVTSTAVSMLLGIFFNLILKDEEKDVEQEEKEEVVQEENVASKE